MDLCPLYDKSQLSLKRMENSKNQRTGDALCDFCKWKNTCLSGNKNEIQKEAGNR